MRIGSSGAEQLNQGTASTADVRMGSGQRPPDQSSLIGAPEGSRKGSGKRNVSVSTAVGVGLGVVAIFLFRAGPRYTMALVTLIAGLASAEYFSAARRKGFHPATLVGVVAATAFPVAAYYRGEAAFPVIGFLAVVFSLLWFVFGVDTDRPAVNAGITLLGVGFVGVLSAFAALILRTPVVQGTSTNILLAALIPTVAHDVFAYFVGRNAGRSPLTPISPGKTVEGLVGGCLAAIIASVLFNSLFPKIAPFDGFLHALLLGLVVALLAPLGDLAESIVKRDFGTKDMGTLLPGHGGAFDRFDSLLFVLPGAYYLAHLLHLFAA